ncbi:protein of unknown function [Ruminococcaceae bacterium BL-6]|nr:protein of unknown function [Ruminococcaceae bacterium BL-6]
MLFPHHEKFSDKMFQYGKIEKAENKNPGAGAKSRDLWGKRADFPSSFTAVPFSLYNSAGNRRNRP